MKSARHATANNVSTYQRDASTTYELSREERFNELNRVSPFRSRWMDPHQHGAAVSPSTPFQKALPDLASWWYSSCLCLGDRPFDRPLNILRLALQEIAPPPGLNSLEGRLQRMLPNSPSEVEAIMKEFQAIANQQAAAQNASLLSRFEELAVTNNTPSPTENQVSPLLLLPDHARPSDRPSQRPSSTMGSMEISDKDIKARKDEFTNNGTARATWYLSIYREVQNATNGRLQLLTDKDKRFYNRYVAHPCRCLVQCCGGSIRMFVDTYGENFNKGKFVCVHNVQPRARQAAAQPSTVAMV